MNTLIPSTKQAIGQTLVLVLRTWGGSNLTLEKLAKECKITGCDCTRPPLIDKGDKQSEVKREGELSVWDIATSVKEPLPKEEPSKTASYYLRNELLCIHVGAFTGTVVSNVNVAGQYSSKHELPQCPKDIIGAPVFLGHEAIALAYAAMIGHCKPIEVQISQKQLQEDLHAHGQAWLEQLGLTTDAAKDLFKPQDGIHDGLQMIHRAYALRSLSRRISPQGRCTKWLCTRGMPVDSETHLTPFLATMKLVCTRKWPVCYVILSQDDLWHLIRMVYYTGFVMCVKTSDNNKVNNKDLMGELCWLADMYFKHGNSLSWAMRHFIADGMTEDQVVEQGLFMSYKEADEQPTDFDDIFDAIWRWYERNSLTKKEQMAFANLHRMLPPHHGDPFSGAAKYQHS